MEGPTLGLRDLPYDCAEALLGGFLRSLPPHQSNCRLLAYSRLFLGPSAADAAAADPDHAVWKAGCAALGLRRWRLLSTWRAMFHQLTVDLDTLGWQTEYRVVMGSDPSDILYGAVDLCLVSVVALAIDAGADVNTTDMTRRNLDYFPLRTALHWACLHGYSEIVTILLEAPGMDARKNAGRDGWRPPLFDAIAGNNPKVEVVDALLRLGGAAADIHWTTPEFYQPSGKTILAMAGEINQRLPSGWPRDDRILPRLLAALEEKAA